MLHLAPTTAPLLSSPRVGAPTQSPQITATDVFFARLRRLSQTPQGTCQTATVALAGNRQRNDPYSYSVVPQLDGLQGLYHLAHVEQEQRVLNVRLALKRLGVHTQSNDYVPLHIMAIYSPPNHVLTNRLATQLDSSVATSTESSVGYRTPDAHSEVPSPTKEDQEPEPVPTETWASLARKPSPPTHAPEAHRPTVTSISHRTRAVTVLHRSHVAYYLVDGLPAPQIDTLVVCRDLHGATLLGRVIPPLKGATERPSSSDGIVLREAQHCDVDHFERNLDRSLSQRGLMERNLRWTKAKILDVEQDLSRMHYRLVVEVERGSKQASIHAILKRTILSESYRGHIRLWVVFVPSLPQFQANDASTAHRALRFTSLSEFAAAGFTLLMKDQLKPTFSSDAS